MDPELLKAHQSFLKKAATLPHMVEKKAVTSKVKQEPPSEGRAPPKKKPRPAPSEPMDPFSYKSMAGSSQFRYAVLYKVLQYMKKRHLDGDTHPLSVDEILDETKQLDVGASIKHWLGAEALPDNPRIMTSPSGEHFIYKPPYPVRDKKTLLRLLDMKDQKGEGGVYLDDIEESLPDADRCIKGLGDRIIHLLRPQDKKTVLFYNDKSCHMDVDDEFVKLWRSVAVDSFDNQKIEETLQKNGISFLRDQGPKKMVHVQKRKSVKKRPVRMQHNEHMASVLKDYDT